MILLFMILCAALGTVCGLVAYEAVDTYETIVSSTRGYRLWKLTTRGKSGIVFGINQHGKLWVELKHAGTTLHTQNIIKGALI